jgi:hypothetical protein
LQINNQRFYDTLMIYTNSNAEYRKLEKMKVCSSDSEILSKSYDKNSHGKNELIKAKFHANIKELCLDVRMPNTNEQLYAMFELSFYAAYVNFPKFGQAYGVYIPVNLRL